MPDTEIPPLVRHRSRRYLSFMRLLAGPFLFLALMLPGPAAPVDNAGTVDHEFANCRPAVHRLAGTWSVPLSLMPYCSVSCVAPDAVRTTDAACCPVAGAVPAPSESALLPLSRAPPLPA